MKQRPLLLNSNNRNNSYAGFTLLECLLALFLFSVICLLGYGYIKNAQIIGRQLQNTSEKEWHIFLIQLENEIRGYDLVSVHSDYLTLYDTEKEYAVLIEMKQNKIIKSANGGYQPLLTRVEAATFRQEEGGIVLQLSFENGKNKEAVLIL
ncbi:ComGF family competence protein [Enterococcus sp. BWM-S5]|uniref:ComGF family competence protein n=1 Tax=Enterococcus larvae TaxID=2794352 RepID=A0ABS4CH85_9ENTE|nr:competence type IV pilus minor pilin ComGF [Enterococcus larvae]MBP1045219.1 ComGF family competence protein [Enterococcus larvae]